MMIQSFCKGVSRVFEGCLKRVLLGVFQVKCNLIHGIHNGFVPVVLLLFLQSLGKLNHNIFLENINFLSKL